MKSLERSLSCTDVVGNTHRPSFRRRHSWNGTSFLEKAEMERFFLQDSDIDSNKSNNEADNGNTNDDKKSYLRKAKAAIIGGSLLGAGILMIPLPGPGILVMAAGGSVIAKEFPEAQRAIDKTKQYCASVIGKGDDKTKNADDESTTTDTSEEATSRTTSADQPNKKEDAIYNMTTLSNMGQAMEEEFYKGFAKAYTKTEKASKKIGRTLEKLTATHMTTKLS